jgi:hypothetical protein
MASTILLMSSVIAGSLVLQSQIGAHEIQSAVGRQMCVRLKLNGLLGISGTTLCQS